MQGETFKADTYVEGGGQARQQNNERKSNLQRKEQWVPTRRVACAAAAVWVWFSHCHHFCCGRSKFVLLAKEETRGIHYARRSVGPVLDLLQQLSVLSSLSPSGMGGDMLWLHARA